MPVTIHEDVAMEREVLAGGRSLAALSKAAITAEQEAWIREVWLPALESGAYRQARGGVLAKIDAFDGETPVVAYCCLGVACVLRHPEHFYVAHNDVQMLMDDRLWYNDVAFDTEEDQWLPMEVQAEIGIGPRGMLGVDIDAILTMGEQVPEALRREVEAISDGSRTIVALYRMNDDGVPFAEIARVIRFVLDHPTAAWFVSSEGDVVRG